MSKSRVAAWMLLAIQIAIGDSAVAAQNFPYRPLRIVAGAAGGSSDFAARTIARGISETLGQNVIVENRSFGVQAIENVIKAEPDGHTMLYFGSAFWTGPLFQKMSYDPVKDLAPVSMVLISPSLLLVNQSVPAKSVKELIALAKASPGKLNYGSGETGSTGHLFAELFKYMAGVNIVRIPFKGQGPAIVSLLGGEIQMLFASAGGMEGYITSGKLRALAVTGENRSPAFPDLPTVSEAGLPGYEAAQRSGIWVPARTPRAIIDRLYRDIHQFTRRPELKKLFGRNGVEPVGSSPQEFAATIKSEMARVGKLIKDANLRVH